MAEFAAPALREPFHKWAVFHFTLFGRLISGMATYPIKWGWWSSNINIRIHINSSGFHGIFSRGEGNTAQVFSTEIAGVRSQESHHRKIMVCVFACPPKIISWGFLPPRNGMVAVTLGAVKNLGWSIYLVGWTKDYTSFMGIMNKPLIIRICFSQPQ